MQLALLETEVSMMTKARRPDADAAPTRPVATGSRQVVPVLAETARVDLVTEQAGALRVRIEVEEVEHTVPGDGVSMRVDLERVPRVTVVAQTRTPWQEGDDVLLVPVYEERPVLGRERVLVEEIHLRTVAVNEAQVHAVRLRRERAVVDRLQPDGRWVATEGMGDSNVARQARDQANRGHPRASERNFR